MNNAKIFDGLKKRGALLLVLTVLSGITTGCTSNSNASTDQVAVTPQVVSATEAPVPYIFTPTAVPAVTQYVLTPTPTPEVTVAPTPIPQVGDLRACYATKRVNGNNVNMRFSPSADSLNLGQVNSGDIVTCVAEYKDWSLVNFWGQLCFIKSKYLVTEYAYESPYTYEEDYDFVYSTSRLNFRLSPEVADNNKIELIPKGAEIVVFGRTSNGWYLAKYNGKIGYVSAEYTTSLKQQIQANHPEIKELRIQSLGSLKQYASLRENPDNTSRVVKNLDAYHTVEILGEYNGYYLAKYGKFIGYISKSSVKKSTDTCIDLDKSEFKLRLYKGCELIFTTTVSIGKDSSPTPEGAFSVKGKDRYKTLTGPGYVCDVEFWMDLDTEDFGLAGGYGLHSYAGKKGKKVSHGCIREDIEDAEYVYNNCPVGTSVNIHN